MDKWAIFLSCLLVFVISPSLGNGGKVAVFCEKNFPYYISPISVKPEIVYDSLKKCGFDVELISADELSDGNVFNADKYVVLVYVYGNTFPLPAFNNLRDFHQKGGSFIFVGGAPFTHPCEKQGSEWVDVIATLGSDFYLHKKVGSVGVGAVIFPEKFHYIASEDPIGMGNFRWDSIPKVGVVQYPVASPEMEDEFIGIVGVAKEGKIRGYPFAIVKHFCEEYKGAIDVWLGATTTAFLPENFIYQIIVKSVAYIYREKGIINVRDFELTKRKAERYFPTYEKLERVKTNGSWLPRSSVPSKELFVLDVCDSPQDEQLLAVSLQGIVNRRKPRVYLLASFYDLMWLEVLEGKGHKIRKVNNIWELLRIFQKEIKGMVVYDPELPDTINIATIVSSVRNAVIASPRIADRIKFTIVEDLRNRFANQIEAYEWAFRSFWKELNHSLLAIMHPSWVFPRDYIIEFKAFTFWIEGVANCWSPPEDILFLRKLLSSTPAHIPILGWWQFGDGGEGSGIGESTGVMLSSKYAKVTVASALCPNLSVHSGVELGIRDFSQQPMEEREVEPKVYISFLLSDGDNFGANLSGVIASKWNQKERGEVAMGWVFCPTQMELTPAVVEHFYSTATPKDYFLSADGIGYVWANFYGNNYENPEDIYREFLFLSKKYMQKLSHDQFWLIQGDGRMELVIRTLEPSALISEWSLPPTQETSRHFIWNGKDCFIFWPITHPWMGWPVDAYRKPEAYVEQIKKNTPKERPAFLVSAVNGFTIGPREIKQIKEQLGDEYVVVSPGELVSLYKRWLKEGITVREDKGNMDIWGWYTAPQGTKWVKKIINLKGINLKDYKKAEIYALVKGKTRHRVRLLVNDKEYSYSLKGGSFWEWVKVTVRIEDLREDINEICYTGNPQGILFTAGDSSVNLGHSFFQGDDGEWRPLSGELVCLIKLLRD